MKRYDVVTSRKDKDGKWRNTKIGAAFDKGDGRISMVLEALPIGNDGQAWLTLFEAKKDDTKKDSPRPTSNDMNDDIPF